MGRHVPTHVRYRILERDGHACQACGAMNVELEVDHIDNTRGPGYNDDHNLQALCTRCHAVKTERERLAGRRRRLERLRLPDGGHPGRL